MSQPCTFGSWNFNPRRSTHSPVDGSPAYRRSIRAQIPRLAVTGMGGHRRPSRSEATRASLARRHGDRHPQRITCVRSQAPGHLLHQTFVAKYPGRQGISAHRPRIVARIRQRAGRFWGAHGLTRTTATAEVTKEVYLKARRILRRWSRNQAIYGDPIRRFPSSVIPRTADRQVERVEVSTGRVTRRRVRRRRPFCTQGGLGGGYVLANNGPTFASQLALAISR